MTRKKQTTGDCVYCGRKMTRAGISRHLQSCNKRQQVIAEANAGMGQEDIFYHLLVHDLWEGDYWLHLEMSGSTPLAKLDIYLRAIWLECCGHLSKFYLERWRDEIPMTTAASQIFEPGIELIHIYDFGTSSETKIKVVSARQGKATTPHPIALLARNDPPEIICAECEQPAAWLCLECMYDYNEEGTLCDEHAETHPHDNYGELVPLANSPRVGMCGYIGPAEPPY